VACPVCGEEGFHASVIAGLTLRRCTACGLRTNATPTRNTTSYANVDPSAYLQSIGRLRREQGTAIVSFVRSHGGSGEWLDVGCGFGYVLEAAQSAGFTVRGIEPDPTAARAARSRAADIEEGFLNESTSPADVLSTLDVLEHLENMNAFAELVKRKTRSLWVIKVPSSDGLFFRTAHALRISSAIARLWQSNYEHPHLVYFNEATLTRFLRKHGFDVVAVRYLDEMPANAVVDRLMLDAAMPRWRALLAVPVIWAINLMERMRSRSDAMVVIARMHHD